MILSIISVEATFLVLIFGWVFKMVRQLQLNITKLSNDLDNHKLHVTTEYFNKKDVLEMIGLVSAPIKVSVDELKMDVVELKRENREDIKELSNKIDILIHNGSGGSHNRRSNDER